MKSDSNHIKLSVICDVFNHAPYLRKCLDGIVMQRTNFKFEVLLHDDLSTDGSREIIKEYADRYPDLFKVILQEKNQYSQGISIWRKYQIPRSTGEYIAFCEGDDYWTDPLKLQKQVDILDAHPEVSMVYTRFDCVDENGNPIDRPFYRELQDSYESGDLFQRIINNNFPLTLTVCMRSEVLADTTEITSPVHYDYTFFMMAALYGELYFLDDVTGCYRMNSNGQILSNMSGVVRKESLARLHFIKAYMSERRYRRDPQEHRRIMTAIARIFLRKRLLFRGRYYRYLLRTPAIWRYLPAAALSRK